MNDFHKWKLKECFVEIRSPGLAFIGERWFDEKEQPQDYWRIEKANSAVIVTIQNGQFLLPVPTYRPGLGKTTLDFPGGRVALGETPATAVPKILLRELGITKKAIKNLISLNSNGWAINSSFSNQKLYGFVAQISPEISVNPEKIGAIYPTTPAGISQLLHDLNCLQCRAVLLEWSQSHT